MSFKHFLPNSVTSNEKVALWKIHSKCAYPAPSGRLFLLLGICNLTSYIAKPIERWGPEARDLNYDVAPYLCHLLL